jgi:hypothetical protein
MRGTLDVPTQSISRFGQREGLVTIGLKLCSEKISVHAPNCRLIWLLLAVVDQHLTTGHGQFLTIILETSQNGEIALIHQLAAETLDIARAGLLLLLCAAVSKGAGRNRNRQQGECQENFLHCIASFRLQKIPSTVETSINSTASGTDL